jgi:hypothetical protein
VCRKGEREIEPDRDRDVLPREKVVLKVIIIINFENIWSRMTDKIEQNKCKLQRSCCGGLWASARSQEPTCSVVSPTWAVTSSKGWPASLLLRVERVRWVSGQRCRASRFFGPPL